MLPTTIVHTCGGNLSEVSEESLRFSCSGSFMEGSRRYPPFEVERKRIMPKKVLIAIPQAMLEQADYIAQCEHRTRSDLIREALRRYLDNFKRTQGAQMSPSSVTVVAEPAVVSIS